MNDERLINEVQKYSVLYNPNDNKYNDSQHKDQIWENIGKKIHHSGSQCKKRWNNVRDNFRKSLKKFQRNVAEGRKATRYKFEEQLQFLMPFFKEDTFIGVTPSDPSEEVGDQHMRTVKSENIAEDSDSSAQSRVSSSSMESSPVVPRKKMAFTKDTPAKSTGETASGTLMNYLLGKVKQEEKTVNAIDSFLAGIGATLKTFPDYQLNIAKTKIFAIVQDLEMKLIMGQLSTNAPLQNHSTTDHPGPSTEYKVDIIPSNIP